jgi:hypothetical protein
MLKHAILALGLAFLVGGTLTRGEVAAPPAVLTNSMATMAAKAEAALTALRIHTLFDQCRQFEDFGVTYQPAVVAPANLASRMGPEQLRMYAGVKLFDAIYAATFLQRQAVAADVKAIEEIQERLDLRSCRTHSNAILRR